MKQKKSAYAALVRAVQSGRRLPAFGSQPARKWFSAHKRLSLYCLAPDPQAKHASAVDAAMKQWTWWPDDFQLKSIRDTVLMLAGTERKYPQKRPWKAFELVDRRMPALRLKRHINELVQRARERFTEAGFSDLEALKPDWSKVERLSELGTSKWNKEKDARDLLRDIGRIKEDVSTARAIDWAKYKNVLSRLPGYGRVSHSSDTALACYARVLELIIGHRRWENLREDSGPLVLWLLEIGHPEANELKIFNRDAAFWALCQGDAAIRREREAKLAKLRQSDRVIKRTKEDIEDDRLMDRVRKGDAMALEELRKRHQAGVGKIVAGILSGNPVVDDLTQNVFVQVWKAAPTYVAMAKFSTWLIEIAKNVALNEKKRSKKEKKRAWAAHFNEHGSKGRKTQNIIGEGDQDEDFSTGGDNHATVLPSGGADDSTRATSEALKPTLANALNELSPLERRIVQARIMAPPSKRKDRQLLARELGITAGEVEDLESKLPGKLRELMCL